MSTSKSPPTNLTSSLKTHRFKLVLLGESAVGKSSLVLRFVKGQFHDYQESTIGAQHHTMAILMKNENSQAAFLTQSIHLEDVTVKFEIWDTAGQERYHSLAPMYYRGAHAAIVVFDIVSQDAFCRAKIWVKELQRQGSPGILICLVGNKIDLEDKRMVETSEAKSYADENGLLFMETSAKTGANVSELFTAIAKKLPINDEVGQTGTIKQRRIDLFNPHETNDQQNACCK